MKSVRNKQMRNTSFGTSRLSLVDKFGTWLSRRAISRQLAGRNGLEILEIGCGFTARNLMSVEDRAMRLVGVDFNLSDEIKTHPKFTALECSAQESMGHLVGQQFDLIMIISVLEHLDEPVEMLRACRALLKPDGVLLINVPTWLGKIFLEYSAFHLGLSPIEEMNDHKMYYDKRDLWPVLIKGGFKPSNIKMRYHKFGLNLFASARVEMSNKKDDWETHWDSYANAASENPAQKMRHDLILEQLHAAPAKPFLLLDIGSGQGDFMAKTVANDCAQQYVGFELSASGVEISSAKVSKANFFQVDLYNPPPVVEEFKAQADAVICSDVIEHVDDPEEFCRLVKGYLKPGAPLYLTVPGGPMSEFDRHIGHRTHYTAASITRLLTAAGFKVDKVNLAGFPFFNLYRLTVILRGKRLISDVETNTNGSGTGWLASFTMRIFGFLFKYNLSNCPLGWQVFTVAYRQE
jgi:2-polyprenyl-3-methyl-5-hydroxy-6-metoxy-1,4-benzoquinol methylase